MISDVKVVLINVIQTFLHEKEFKNKFFKSNFFLFFFFDEHKNKLFLEQQNKITKKEIF